jgi:uncharacterized lipoprotein YajG
MLVNPRLSSPENYAAVDKHLTLAVTNFLIIKITIMKKYMIASAALLLFAGMTNAQVAQKQASKATAVKQAAYTKPSSVSTKNTNAVASVSPTAKKTTAPNMTIKRKHHHKKTKATTTAGKN